MAASSRERFNWEDAVAQDVDLQRINAYVNLTVSKLSVPSPVRADAGRGGSRYEPPPAPTPNVKTEQPSSAVNLEPPHSTMSQYIDPRDYQSESSSEIDTREVNPMDELSDFETETLAPPPQPMDIEEEVEEEQEQGEEQEQEEEKTQTVCEVCKNSEHENEIILCDKCDAEFHLRCLSPPLSHVPEGNWFCPKCRVHESAPAPAVHVKTEQTTRIETQEQEPENIATVTTSAEMGTSILEQENAPIHEGPSNDVSTIPIAQSLEGDPEKSNLLLIHACNCDDIQCTDRDYHLICAHMKRFLRSVCWASHSDKWRSYRLAWITAELFAYHAMHCTLVHCNVPLCVKIRQEEIV